MRKYVILWLGLKLGDLGITLGPHEAKIFVFTLQSFNCSVLVVALILLAITCQVMSNLELWSSILSLLSYSTLSSKKYLSLCLEECVPHHFMANNLWYGFIETHCIHFSRMNIGTILAKIYT